MSKMRATIAGLFVCGAAAMVAATGIGSSAGRSVGVEDARRPVKTAPPDPTAEGEAYRFRNRVVAYEAAVTANQAAAWYAAAYWNDIVRLYRPPQSPPKTKSAPIQVPRAPDRPRTDGKPAGGGGSCGGATNGADRFIGPESGGNPNVYNAEGSGAWGCYQIMPDTWRGSCSDLGQHGSAGTDAQAQCASRLPSSSWAATGG